MTRWAVTGPAGGGKSTFCRLLALRGAAVIDGDALGHEVLALPEIISAIGDRFGEDFLSDGQVDRPSLGKLVFGDASALEQLNSITLAPLGRLAAERLDSLAGSPRCRLAVLEAAVYFLLPPVPGMDLVITVTADPGIRVSRLTGTGRLTEAQAHARVTAQVPMEAAWAGADIVLHNDGSLQDLEAAADRLWDGLPE